MQAWSQLLSLPGGDILSGEGAEATRGNGVPRAGTRCRRPTCVVCLIYFWTVIKTIGGFARTPWPRSGKPSREDRDQCAPGNERLRDPGDPAMTWVDDFLSLGR